MTKEQALEQLKINTGKEPLTISGSATRMADYFKALSIASDALEKQVAKKPIQQSTDEKIHYKCICGKILMTVYTDGIRQGYTPNYCPICGQKLDWS